jgi:dGTPase
VAQVGLRLAEHLARSVSADQLDALGGLDRNVVEAAALAHDLGHPPFGHIAEKTLNKLILAEGFVDGYEGNAQAFRILTRLAVRVENIEGLNLTRATLNASLKYPWLQRNADKKTGAKTKEGKKRDKKNSDKPQQEEHKWGAYSSEKEYLTFARELQPGAWGRSKCLEAQVMDWADDIAYSVGDTEDFYRAGLIPLDRILASARTAHQFVDAVFTRWQEINITDEVRGRFELDDLRRSFVNIREFVPVFKEPYEDRREIRAALRKFTSNLIGRFVQKTKLRVAPDSRGNLLDIPDECLMEVRMLKELTWQYVIKNSALAGQQYGQQQIITKLFHIYQDAIGSGHPDAWDVLPARDRHPLRAMPKERTGGHLASIVVTRLAADAIAGMTDQQALLMYQRLTGVSPGGAFDAWAR